MNNLLVPKTTLPRCVNFFPAIDHIKKTEGVDGRKLGPRSILGDTMLVDNNIFDFIHKKGNEMCLFPKMTHQKYCEEKKIRDSWYNEFYENEAIIFLPRQYDPAEDFKNFLKDRKEFEKTMLETLGKKEYDKLKDKFDTHVDFGNQSFDFINPFLEILWKNFSHLAIDGKLPVWLDKEEYQSPVEIQPLENVIFFTDLVQCLTANNVLNPKDENLLYKWILKGNYIEGRYWEREWRLGLSTKNFREEKIPTKLQKAIFFIEENFAHLLKEERGNERNLPIFLDKFILLSKKEQSQIW